MASGGTGWTRESNHLVRGLRRHVGLFGGRADARLQSRMSRELLCRTSKLLFIFFIVTGDVQYVIKERSKGVYQRTKLNHILLPLIQSTSSITSLLDYYEVNPLQICKQMSTQIFCPRLLKVDYLFCHPSAPL